MESPPLNLNRALNRNPLPIPTSVLSTSTSEVTGPATGRELPGRLPRGLLCVHDTPPPALKAESRASGLESQGQTNAQRSSVAPAAGVGIVMALRQAPVSTGNGATRQHPPAPPWRRYPTGADAARSGACGLEHPPGPASLNPRSAVPQSYDAHFRASFLPECAQSRRCRLILPLCRGRTAERHATARGFSSALVSQAFRTVPDTAPCD